MSQKSSNLPGGFPVGHDGARVGARAWFVAGETKTVVVMAQQTEVRVERGPSEG